MKNYRPTSARHVMEMDPCIAAEQRLSTSVLSTRIKAAICVGFVVAMFITLILMVVLLTLTERNPLSPAEETATTTTTELPHTTRRMQVEQTARKRVPMARTSFRPTTPPRVHIEQIRDMGTNKTSYRSCADAFQSGRDSAVISLRPNTRTFSTVCEKRQNGEIWTIFHKRVDGAIEFYNRSWTDYQYGFGNPATSYWLGLENLYELLPTDGSFVTLRIEMHGDYCGDSGRCSNKPDGVWWGEWDFRIGSVETSYTLRISEMKRGNLVSKVDHFKNTHDGKPFTTYDHDNDKMENHNCASLRNYGGWWHNDCGYTALNGMYGDNTPNKRYQYWYQDEGKTSYYIHPKQSFMMIRTE